VNLEKGPVKKTAMEVVSSMAIERVAASEDDARDPDRNGGWMQEEKA
jgi:hypothetical protein